MNEDQTSMPEPIYVMAIKCQASGRMEMITKGEVIAVGWVSASGPMTIIPGMMSLDELAERGFEILRRDRDGVWGVFRFGGKGVWLGELLPTALEAQWAATQLAKEGGS